MTTFRFEKLLIANRGEIACRIIRTARQLGLRTVAIYSVADKNALHVLLADEAYLVGPAPSRESYLAIDQVLAACRESGAQAVHPGYGFLSENAEFAERVADVGLVFVGPTPHAIRSMGDKITSKRLAQEAGVNTIPGHPELLRDADEAVAIAAQIGYPVMLKATAGGGGKGMRVARNDDECREGFQRATSEARSSFGDARVFLEKFIEQPRHVEIQVLADAHGQVIHLGERECSLQRRHQKIIEESPSPVLDAPLRQAMGEQAVALARAVEYQSAGTVEFIVDEQRNFYFLEMNTRLQVEHPVTELVTGIDLVEQMLRVADGQRLTWTQADVRQTGWAIEARVYAEDPFRNFLPSVGRLVRYRPPEESPHVRVDTGVFEGDEISMHYDPMIAKLITYGADREEATAVMRRALNQFYLLGVSHNISFLAALIENPRFRAGQLSTNLIAEQYPDGFHPADLVHDNPNLILAVAAAVHRRYMDRAASISGQMKGYERKVDGRWVVVMQGKHFPVEVTPLPNGRGHDVRHGDETLRVISDWQFGQPLFNGTVEGTEVNLIIERRNMFYRLLHWGSQLDVMVLTAKAAELLACMPQKAPPDTSKLLLSPMPGLLSALMVEEGNEVKSGQDLAVIEAMKMENVLRAPRDGIVAKSLAAVGDTLAVDQPILEFEFPGQAGPPLAS
jgi:propionyl-CoA carboxylase alpha chain